MDKERAKMIEKFYNWTRALILLVFFVLVIYGLLIA